MPSSSSSYRALASVLLLAGAILGLPSYQSLEASTDPGLRHDQICASAGAVPVVDRQGNESEPVCADGR